MSKDFNISPHFTFSEMTRSTERPDLELANRTGAVRHFPALHALAWGILEPIRRKWGATSLSSCFRGEELNRAVGGDSESDHLRGCAADIWKVQNGSLEELYRWVMRSDLPYGQVILEDTRGGGWNAVHVSIGWPLNDEGKDRENWVLAGGAFTPPSDTLLV